MSRDFLERSAESRSRRRPCGSWIVRTRKARSTKQMALAARFKRRSLSLEQAPDGNKRLVLADICGRRELNY